MSEEERVSQEQVPDGEATTPEADTQSDSKEELMKQFSNELDKAKRHFQGVAQKQVNEFRRELEQERYYRGIAEEKVDAMQQRYLESLDGEGQVKYLTQRIHDMERQSRAPVPQPVQDQGPSVNDILREQIRAQGVDPDDSRIDWANDESDYRRGAERLGASIAKIKGDDIDKKIKAEIAKIEKAARAKVEEEYEVGSGARVETGGTHAGGQKKVTRKQIVDDDISDEDYINNVLGGRFG